MSKLNGDRKTDNPDNFDPVEKGVAINFGFPANYARIYQAQKNPDIWIKEIEEIDNEDKLNKVIEDYKFLRHNLGDIFPDNQLVLAGKDKKTVKAYILMKKVTAVPLTMENRDQYFAELDALLARVINFYIDHATANKYGETVSTIPDINQRNLVYGTIAGQSKPKLYCVDNYPSLTLGLEEFCEIISQNTNTESDRFPQVLQAYQRLNVLIQKQTKL